VWHHLTQSEVQQHSSELAQEMVFSTSEGFKEIARLIQSAFAEQQRPVFEFSYETVLVDTVGDIVHREQHIGSQHVEELGNGVALEMVSVPGGIFVMGAPETEAKQRPAELPRHTVTVGPLYVSKCPITQIQWEAVMGNNPSNFKADTLPVETVSWHDAVEFCQRLSMHAGRTYRLPTEAEWEYACRAGTSTPFYFGETITTSLANYNGAIPYANEPGGNFRQHTSEVGQFPPNNFGLYDMHGNVREWCADPWHSNYRDAPSKAIVWEEWGNSSLRVLRGGAWDFNCFSCRSAARNWRFPVFGSPNIGFRVVYTATPE
jgi:formylglycine-generating enzyme required for sulfatase activity